MASFLFAKNFFSQVASRVVLIFLSFLLVRVLTTSFGKEGYGFFGFVTALVLLFATIADWGTQMITAREASRKEFQDKEKQNLLLSTALILRFALAVVAFLLINILVRFYAPWQDFVVAISVASLVLFFLSLKTTFNVIFQVALKLERAAFVEVVGSLLFFALAILFVGRANINGVFAAWVIATAVAAGFGWILARQLFTVRPVFNPSFARRIIIESLPMGGLLLVFSIYNRADILILEHFWGVGEVGIYNLAYKVHENLVLGAAFAMNAIFPILSAKWSAGEKAQLVTIYKNTFGFLFIAGLGVAICFFALAPIVIQILTGGEYHEFIASSLALRILLFATVISYLNHLTGYSLVAFGRQRFSLIIGIAALIFNISANIIFIPLYSFKAAAVITVLTESLIFIASSFAVWQCVKITKSNE